MDGGDTEARGDEKKNDMLMDGETTTGPVLSKTLSSPKKKTAQSSPPPQQPQQQTAPVAKPPAAAASMSWHELCQNMLCISIFAMWGAWTRYQLYMLQTNKNTFKESDFLNNSFFLPNVFGSFIMGVLTKYPSWLASVKDQNISTALSTLIQTGLSVGYCGSLTTFSTWMESVGQNFAQATVPVAFNVFLTGLAAYLAAFELGTQVWKLLEVSVPHHRAFAKRYHDLALLFCFLIAVVTPLSIMASAAASNPADRLWTPKLSDLTCLLFAPAGALCRWFLARRFNPNAKTMMCKFNCAMTTREWFPLGTFIANATGTLIASFVTVYTAPVNVDDLTGTYFIAFNFYFSGSLSTVSTLIKEFSMTHTHIDPPSNSPSYKGTHILFEKYGYGLVTFLVSLSIAIFVVAGKEVYGGGFHI
eukprot:TRINITY_DN15665_c0_g2_i2.p1 TRINITY_DN15665_c0_g2~~TRINITY_DN15665_c0_g2_i2.p1  ORF type:complete len:483 (-),score=110.29 TRINITY_DN15665_c0_g2_i2:118-1368(-)